MRRIALFSLSAGLGLASACSLHSLDHLDDCRRSPSATECQGGSSSAGVSATSGSDQGGSTNAGSPALGGSSVDGGVANGAAGGAGSPTEGGGGGEAPMPRTVVALYADYSEGKDKDPLASTQVRAAFNLVNESTEVIPLSELTLRYYYTLENDSSEQTVECDYPNDGDEAWKCDAIGVVFGTLPAGRDATHYIDVTFAPSETWNLPARGGTSGTFKLRFRKMDYSTQVLTNDYSYVEGDDTEPTLEQPKVTIYRNGELIWGVEPL